MVNSCLHAWARGIAHASAQVSFRAAVTVGLALGAALLQAQTLPAATPAASTASPAIQLSAAKGAAVCKPNPFPATELFLRGSMNNWAARDDYAFRYQCDAYYLNVRLATRHEFKVSDDSWSQGFTFGAPNQAAPVTLQASPAGLPAAPGVATLPVGRAADAGGVGNMNHVFHGEQTIRLAWDAAHNRPSLSIGPKSMPDAPASSVTHPLALSLRYDSRALAHKAPFGAVKAGTTVRFSVSALPGIDRVVQVIEKRTLQGDQEVLEYAELTRLPMTKEKSGSKLDESWTSSYIFNSEMIAGYYFEAEVGGQRFVLQNNKDSVYWTREVGSNGQGLVAEAPASNQGAKRIRRFRQTVYRADFAVPAWARDTVYYYIFPERFRNGNAANDPKPGRDTYQKHGVEFHTNWLDTPFRPGSGDGSDAAYNNDFFGGDIAGIIEKLDYIAGLGANALYITPMFKAASNHKYDTADYKHIDPAFGSDADFTRLTVAAARRGIRVIPDTSLNHTGSDSIYFDRYAKHAAHGAFEGGKINPASPYASWYTFDARQTEPDKQYKGWVGVGDLPELNKASLDYREFALGAKDSVTRLWLQRGAAGWRMDVAPWVPDDFWREWRKVVKATKPDALTVAETWWDGSKYMLGDTFDATMNYILRSTVLDYARGDKATGLYHNIEFMREAYPEPSLFAQMNLLSSHDVMRSLNYLGAGVEGGVLASGGQQAPAALGADGAHKLSPAALAKAKARMRLAVFFQMTFPGAPTVYYGDEVGLEGGEDPYNRSTYPWADLGGQPDQELLADFKRLIGLRREHAVLRHGSLAAPLHLDEHVIVQARHSDGSWAIVATNNAETARTVSVQLPPGVPLGKLRDALTGATVSVAGGRISIDIPALFGTLLVTP